MKIKILFIAISFIFSIVILNSCEEEGTTDTEKPVISGLEVGHDDTLHVGEGVHLEFEVSDNDALNYYQIIIHPEGEDHEHEEKLQSVSEHEHWEFDSTFTEIAGLKNKTVHHHNIIVSEEAELGEYHFHLSAVDKSGNVTEIEKDVIVAEEDGEDYDHEHED